MATIDDVYNLLVDSGIGLGAINNNVNDVAAAVGARNISNTIGILRAQLEPPTGGDNVLSKIEALYLTAVDPGGNLYKVGIQFGAVGPGTLGDYISETRFAVLDIKTAYLDYPGAFDPGDTILKRILTSVSVTFDPPGS